MGYAKYLGFQTLSNVLLNGKLENTHIERIEMEWYQYSCLIYLEIQYISIS